MLINEKVIVFLMEEKNERLRNAARYFFSLKASGIATMPLSNWQKLAESHGVTYYQAGRYLQDLIDCGWIGKTKSETNPVLFLRGRSYFTTQFGDSKLVECPKEAFAKNTVWYDFCCAVTMNIIRARVKNLPKKERIRHTADKKSTICSKVTENTSTIEAGNASSDSGDKGQPVALSIMMNMFGWSQTKCHSVRQRAIRSGFISITPILMMLTNVDNEFILGSRTDAAILREETGAPVFSVKGHLVQQMPSIVSTLSLRRVKR